MLKALSISCPNPKLRKHEKIEGVKKESRKEDNGMKEKKQVLRNEFEKCVCGGEILNGKECKKKVKKGRNGKEN